ncbi:DUF6248 family natural product biosynthesis protein [Streptosporangium canum]|uniref:DUF6248 family natural product biosynthesis protein n=1 Tax=Streptosporangium canum TaxID=324952 RepID=UPI0036A0D414
MTPDRAAWVREHAWTAGMRKQHRDAPGYYLICACQSGPTWHCSNDMHGQCNRATPLTAWEDLICDRTGIYPVHHAEPHHHPTPSITGPRRERLAMVYLADRICRWICSCGCHTGVRPVPVPAPETVSRTSWTYEAVELPGLTLEGAR